MKNLTNVELAMMEAGIDFELLEELEAKAFAKNSVAPYNVIVSSVNEMIDALLNEIHVAGITTMANKVAFKEKGIDKGNGTKEYAEVSIESLSKGPLAKLARLEEGPVTKEGVTLGDNYKFTRDYLVVNVAEDSKVGALIKRNGLAVQYKMGGRRGNIMTRNVNEMYTMSLNKKGVLVLSPTINKEGNVLAGEEAQAMLDKCVHYRIMSASQAQERNVEMILSNRDAKFVLHAKIALSGRFLLELFYKHNNKIKFNDAAKEWFKRDALIGSTMIPFGEISKENGTGMVILFDEFLGNETDVVETELANKIGYMQDNSSKVFKKANNGTKDGITFGRKTYIANAAYKEYGISIAANLVNVDPQMRITGAGVKSLIELKEDAVFDEMLARAIKGKKRVSLDEALRRLQVQRETGVKAKFSADEYVVIGDENNICFLADDNASKYLAFEGKYRVMLLDMPRVKKNTINLSWQVFNKLANFASDETLNYLSDRFVESMANKVADMLFENNTPTLVGNTSTVALSLSERAKNVYGNVLSLLGDMTQEIVSKVEGGKVPVSGIYTRAAFESSDMIAGINILEAGDHYAEVYCPSLRDGEYTTGFKFPCPTKDEFQVFKNVGYKTLCKRIGLLVKAGKITKREAELLKANFRGYGASTLVIVQEDSLKHKLAGMDTDYDGLQIVRDTQIVNDAISYYKELGYCGESVVIAKFKK